jgi:hypothetical protein
MQPTSEPTLLPVIRAYLDAYNTFDVDAMMACVTDDVRFEHHTGGVCQVATQGRAELEALARQSVPLFASRRQVPMGVRLEGDEVIVDIAFHGEIAEDIPDGPGAGTVIEMTGQSSFLIGANGRIARVIDRA